MILWLSCNIITEIWSYSLCINLKEQKKKMLNILNVGDCKTACVLVMIETWLTFLCNCMFFAMMPFSLTAYSLHAWTHET